MIIDSPYLRTLEFDQVLERLAAHTAFSAGKELALALRPLTDATDVAERLQETTEAKALLAVKPETSIGGARDVRGIAYRAGVSGQLRPEEFLQVRATLLSARRLRGLLLRLEDEYPMLSNYGYELQPLTEIVESIDRCLDDDGRVLDSASPTLARVRREAAIARDRVVERLHSMITSSRNEAILQDAIVTERNGRYVIPVKAEFKSRIPGIIHDQSSSGATLWIEPLSTVDLNNRWHQLQLEERDEIEHILYELTRAVGQEAETVRHDVDMLAALDLIFAKALYSFEIKAVPAELRTAEWKIGQEGEISSPAENPLNLIKARHPLLDTSTVVPIDIYSGADFTALIITGPNTGGKTVALKTVGLFAAMNQAGLHIPAMDGSCLPVFSGIYADIGDEQSIEQSLSTFSSHISRIIDIYEHADEHSLVLLDELGAGTDPVEGAALAQSLIQAFQQRNCLLFASTHYSQLKIFAYATPGVQNASVEFDVQTLSPTFHLSIGVPGRSNAFAIASRLGLDGGIINYAERLISAGDTRSEELLSRVRDASDAAESARLETEQRLAQAHTYEEQLRVRLSAIEEARRQVLEEARAQGREQLAELEEQIQLLRRGLPAAAERQELADLADHIHELAAQVAPISVQVDEPADPDQNLLPGDKVFVTTLKQSGELVSIGSNEAEVMVGGFRLRTQPSRLRFESRPRKETAAQQMGVGRPRPESPGLELDMRGWRAEEVAPELDPYLDRAYLSGLPWVRLIHGKGMGVLRQVVRQFLDGHPLVSSYRPGVPGEGGEGVTVVTLIKKS